MTLHQLHPTDLESWGAAWCHACADEVQVDALQDVATEPGWEGPIPFVVHMRGEPCADGTFEPGECGPVVEAAWAGRFLVDASTGEVLDVEKPEGFRVTDRASAEWVMERIFDSEAEVAALEARAETIRKNIARMAAEHARKAQWLRDRFGPQLEEWARAELAGKKVRTVRTPFGALAFRKTKPKLSVTDLARAVEWCKEHVPDAVKVQESILVSMIPDTAWKDLNAAFDITPAGDSFRVDVSTPRPEAGA